MPTRKIILITGASSGLGQGMAREFAKLGRDLVFQVTVFEREERKRRKLFAETQCSDPFHLVIQFIIRDAPDRSKAGVADDLCGHR